jgi:hypothetical protein
MHSVRTVRRRLLPVALPVLLAAAALPGGAQAATKTVHMSGTAYEFNVVHVMLAGATIRVAEYPKLSATVASDGTYDLKVPDGKRITPYIVASGYHTIYLQTFTTDGQDLVNVNFQTPSDGVTAALTQLVDVPHDANGYPTQCAVVSTFNTKNVRGVSYQDFIGYGAHGVAGATAHTSPALPTPIYFNEHVLPDPMQQLSSKDGGVIWTRVPTGTYTMSATSPTTRFASFVATCKPGRIINANPPWGLHELATTVGAKVAAKWKTSKAHVAKLRSLSVGKLPVGATVTVGTGKGHVVGSVTKKALVKAAGKLRAGQTLRVAVAAPAFNTKVVTWRIPRRGTPKATTTCIPLGDSAPQKRC